MAKNDSSMLILLGVALFFMLSGGGATVFGGGGGYPLTNGFAPSNGRGLPETDPIIPVVSPSGKKVLTLTQARRKRHFARKKLGLRPDWEVPMPRSAGGFAPGRVSR